MRRAHARAALAALAVTGTLFAETAGASTQSSSHSLQGAASASAVSDTAHTAGRAKATGDSLTYNPGEPWTSASLVAAYKDAYHGFLDKLRARYGSRPVIVVSATAMSNTTAFADAARQIVQERGDRGDDRIRYWYYDSAGLDYGGCDWHPSARDHRIISERLNSFIATLGLRW